MPYQYIFQCRKISVFAIIKGVRWWTTYEAKGLRWTMTQIALDHWGRVEPVSRLNESTVSLYAEVFLWREVAVLAPIGAISPSIMSLEVANRFLSFVNSAPTPFHAVLQAALRLEKAGFVKVIYHRLNHTDCTCEFDALPRLRNSMNGRRTSKRGNTISLGLFTTLWFVEFINLCH